MPTFEWTCGFCNHPQVATDNNCSTWAFPIKTSRGSAIGGIHVRLVVIKCLNSACRQINFDAAVLKDLPDEHHNWRAGDELYHWRLLPASSAKPQPECVPEPLRSDYYEACSIRDLSPKASATLSRRVLQGMIRDFCGIAKNRLIDEIAELHDRINAGNAPPGVTPESVDGIDYVRAIGNIGAHMEKDISVIVDVDPGEAQILIELVETLFDEWYVAREARRARFDKLAAIKAAKDAQKKPGGSAPPTKP